MRMLEKFVTAVLLLLVLLTAPSTADIISVRLDSDDRHIIFLSEFKFSRVGYISLDISLFTVTSNSSLPDPSRIGFVLETQHQQNTICPLDIKSNNSVIFTFQNHSSDAFNKSYAVTYPGMHSLLFVNCNSESLVTIDGRAELYNTDDHGTTKNYLSAELTQLPFLYFFSSSIHLCFLVFWILVCFKNRRCFHRMHLLMGGLLLLNFVQLICAAADLYYVKLTGAPHGFDDLFYVFQLIRNVFLFTVIVLIGSGWRFWKPFIGNKEHLVLITVILFQVGANVNSILTWKFTGPYRENWAFDSIGFDIICCFVVFVPMVWSIMLLIKRRETGHAPMNRVRLCLFGFVVFAYVLCTRLLVRGLFSPWVNYGVQEISILVLCMVIFYIFRPLDKDDYGKAVRMAVWKARDPSSFAGIFIV